jgi:hypothetical protein
VVSNSDLVKLCDSEKKYPHRNFYYIVKVLLITAQGLLRDYLGSSGSAELREPEMSPGLSLPVSKQPLLLTIFDGNREKVVCDYQSSPNYIAATQTTLA